VKKVQDFFKKIFHYRLLVLIPIWATYYVLSSLLGLSTGAGRPAGIFVGTEVPGLGIITLILFILLIGVLSANYIGKNLVSYGDNLCRGALGARRLFTIKRSWIPFP